MQVCKDLCIHFWLGIVVLVYYYFVRLENTDTAKPLIAEDRFEKSSRYFE